MDTEDDVIRFGAYIEKLGKYIQENPSKIFDITMEYAYPPVSRPTESDPIPYREDSYFSISFQTKKNKYENIRI